MDPQILGCFYVWSLRDRNGQLCHLSSLIPKLVGIDCHQYLRIRLEKLIVLRQNSLAQLQ